MGQQFRLTGTVAEQLRCSRKYLLERAKDANLDLDVADGYKLWSEENIRLVSGLVNKRVVLESGHGLDQTTS